MSDMPPKPGKPELTQTGIQLRVNPQWEVHPAELKEMLERGQDVLLLDVRRLPEYNIYHFPGAKLITLDQLEAQAETLADWKNRKVIVHCHHGVRSLNGTAILRHKGFTDVHSLAGGLDAWSLMIDPAVPRY